MNSSSGAGGSIYSYSYSGSGRGSSPSLMLLTRSVLRESLRNFDHQHSVLLENWSTDLHKPDSNTRCKGEPTAQACRGIVDGK
jgi:hypothetical protein